VPHPDFGEGVVAVLVPQPSASIDPKAIRSGIAEQIAKFKQPKVIEVLPELPRNTMGKVQKNLLRDQFGTAFAK
jgi:malonyl-CoA/methylmalonyl-CoA synthetase